MVRITPPPSRQSGDLWIPHSHGSQISTLATTTTARGVDKGAIISTAASGGKSKAGQHGKAGDQHGKAGDQHGNPTQPDPPANSNKGGNGGGPK